MMTCAWKSWSRPWWIATLFATGCTGPMIELETESADTGPSDTTGNPPMTSTTVGATDTVDPDDSGGPVPTQRAVDILFVVDNSGSMGEEQGNLAASLPPLIDLLANGVDPVDMRIAVTTTDNGNPWCQGTAPEAGSLRATSCIERLGEFVFQGGTTIDASQEGCLDFCTMEQLSLPVPWIEYDPATGTSNVPGGDVLGAVQCMVPQGIDGCGFEQPLESARKAILRFETAGEAAFGFHREGALLAVAFVTDEADCSYNDTWETIFLPDGDRVFWSDPSAPAPSSAVCWNAGVACTGGGGGSFDDCYSINYNVGGAEVATNPEQNAVLRPITRYTSQLAEQGAYVVAISGVTTTGMPAYSVGADPQFVADFGIGPGCSSPSGQAVPPVRLREVIESTSGPGNLYSVCEPSYQNALGAFAQGILDRLP